MPKALTKEEVTALYASARARPTASYSWGVASFRSPERLTSHGWYKTEWQAKTIARHLQLSEPPIICHRMPG